MNIVGFWDFEAFDRVEVFMKLSISSPDLKFGRQYGICKDCNVRH